VDWYYSHATENDEFFTDCSGISYIYPSTFACRFKDKQIVLDRFLQWTNKYMARMDHNAIRMVGSTPEMVELYANKLTNAKFQLPDFGHFGELFDLKDAVYCTKNGKPVFHAMTPLTVGSGGKEALLKSITDISMQLKNRPLFVNAFVNFFEQNIEGIKWLTDNTGSEIVFVTPSQLAQLYREANK
jgi:hypothetical protein